MDTNRPFKADPPDFQGSTQTLNKDDRTWGMLAHLTALAGYIITPLGWSLGPLVIWLVKREEIPFVDDQGKEALNFNISMTLYILVSAILIWIRVGFLLIILVLVLHLVFTITASLKASEGQLYRYPLTIRFIS